MSAASPADMSHAMLIGILMNEGGSYVMPATAMEADAIGGADGAFHAVAMEPLQNGQIRLSVRPRPDVDEAGI
ncbi:pRL2-19, partial [Streptomyces lunaelactis]|uniref:pRL2-19 n=1 Tax=Streptomyces lunaelactis TaxID=1535768 RepID=UPI0015853BF4